MADEDFPRRRSKRPQSIVLGQAAISATATRQHLDQTERPTAAERDEATRLISRMAVELEALRTFQPRFMNYFACALAVRRGECLRGDFAMRQKFGGDRGVKLCISRPPLPQQCTTTPLAPCITSSIRLPNATERAHKHLNKLGPHALYQAAPPAIPCPPLRTTRPRTRVTYDAFLTCLARCAATQSVALDEGIGSGAGQLCCEQISICVRSTSTCACVQVFARSRTCTHTCSGRLRQVIAACPLLPVLRPVPPRRRQPRG